MSKKRKRNIRIEFYVLPEEKKLITLKMGIAKYKSMSSYLRQAACYNKVIVKDYNIADFKDMNKELNSIGVCINQMAARVNSTGTIYKEDIDFLKDSVQNIYSKQRNILSRLLR